MQNILVSTLKTKAKLSLIVCLTNIKNFTSTCNQHKIINNDILYYLCHSKSSKSSSIVARFGHDCFSVIKRNVLLYPNTKVVFNGGMLPYFSF